MSECSKMLQHLSRPRLRCIWTTLIFVLVWGLVMIAALQWRSADNGPLQAQQRDLLSKSPTLPGKPVANSRDDDRREEGTRGIGGGRIGGGGRSEYGRVLGDRDEPLVDKRKPRTQEELVREIETGLPSLPLAYWLKTSLHLVNGSKPAGGKASSLDKKKAKLNEKENTKDAAKRRPEDKRNGKGCVPRFPSIFDLEFNNIYWQTLRSTNGTFPLFGAYYDERKLSRIGPAVRIVGMIDRIEPRGRTYCQMWFDGNREPAVIETLEYKYVWYSKWGNYKQGIYHPYVIACKVPQSHWKRGPPASVSIVERACDTSTNNLRVIYNKPDVKKGFAVCVKGLDFLHDDLSVRLVEWIELIGLLGADKIYFYQLQVHPNVSKVLDHYAKLGKIEVTPLTLPGGQPNVPAFQHMYLTKKTNNKRQNELIPYNDCLYKHMYEYEYIALLDVDEVIMPLRDSTWPELMKRVLPKALAIRNETRASYNVRNVYFLDDLLHSHGSFDHLPRAFLVFPQDGESVERFAQVKWSPVAIKALPILSSGLFAIPQRSDHPSSRYMHMLQHVYRSKNFTKPNQYVKCFHNPERVVTLDNNFPLACLGAGCTSYPIESEDARLQHYRADCVKSLKKTCLQYRENSVMDTAVWRHKDRLVERVSETLERLGLLRRQLKKRYRRLASVYSLYRPLPDSLRYGDPRSFSNGDAYIAVRKGDSRFTISYTIYY